MTDSPQTLPAVLQRAARQWPDRPAIVAGEMRIAYADLLERSTTAARAFIALGVAAGDRVAIWAPNCFEWILAACGVHAAGAMVVPVSTRMKGPEAADVLEQSGARVLVSCGDFLGQYFPALLDDHHPATLQHVIVLRGAARGAELAWEAFLARAEQTPAAVVQARSAALTGDSISDLMFTSGTTGRPKGVLAKHGAAIRAFTEWAKVVGLDSGANYLVANPFSHSFGYKAGWVAAFLRGATVYPHAIFDADEILARIEREKINFLPGPPTLYLKLLEHPRLRDYDLSSLHGAVTGAASVPPILIRRMREELGIDHVTTAYGLTECGGCATICDPTDDVETIAHTCGHALPGTELRCVDRRNQPVPISRPGEVVLRGYHVMQGYFNNAEATREAIDSEGWLHTGDIGVLDERGYLRITDRLKDMFIVGGFNCYPAEIERLLADHPAIAQVAVVSVPDPEMGEVGCACVVLRAGHTLTLDALVQWSRTRMSNYKIPRHLRLFDALPMNASSKVMKTALRTIVSGDG